jgi:hypothetical protein
MPQRIHAAHRVVHSQRGEFLAVVDEAVACRALGRGFGHLYRHRVVRPQLAYGAGESHRHPLGVADRGHAAVRPIKTCDAGRRGDLCDPRDGVVPTASGDSDEAAVHPLLLGGSDPAPLAAAGINVHCFAIVQHGQDVVAQRRPAAHVGL